MYTIQLVGAMLVCDTDPSMSVLTTRRLCHSGHPTEKADSLTLLSPKVRSSESNDVNHAGRGPAVAFEHKDKDRFCTCTEANQQADSKR